MGTVVERINPCAACMNFTQMLLLRLFELSPTGMLNSEGIQTLAQESMCLEITREVADSALTLFLEQGHIHKGFSSPDSYALSDKGGILIRYMMDLLTKKPDCSLGRNRRRE